MDQESPPSGARLAAAVVLAAACLLTSGCTAATPEPGSETGGGPRVLVRFDLTDRQMPENIALEPDGSVDLTLSFTGRVVRVGPTGQQQTLAQLPVAPRGDCPVLHVPATVSGIARDDGGTLYVNFCTGLADTHGIWTIPPGGTPTRMAALLVSGFPNGLALDAASGLLYVADSQLGAIWRVPVRDGAPAQVWAMGPELAPTGFIGANGIKVHDGAVWVANTDRGTLLRIPIGPDGSAGPVGTRAVDVDGIDDFAFSGRDDTIVAAVNEHSQVVVVSPTGEHRVVLTAADGLSNPSAVAVRDRTIFVSSAAYLTRKDPNLLTARLNDAGDGVMRR